MKKDKEKFVPAKLRECAALYEERNKVYGDNYLKFGVVMAEIFPNGITLNTAEDFNRFGIFVQKVSKLTRYASQYENGGHDDSLLDDSVYSIMLLELDDLANQKSKKVGKRTSAK